MKKRIFEKRFFENKIFEKRKSILSAVLIASITLAAPFSGVRAENATSGDASPSSAVTSTQSGSEKVMRDNIFINGQDMSGVTFDEAIKNLSVTLRRQENTLQEFINSNNRLFHLMASGETILEMDEENG